MQREDQSIHKIESAYMKHYEAQKMRKKRRKKQLFRRLLVVTISFLILVAFMGSYHIKQRMTYAKKEKEYIQLQEQLTQLEKDEKGYLEEIALLNSDEYVLEIARTNYFFSKEGELIFKILDEDSSY